MNFDLTEVLSSTKGHSAFGRFFRSIWAILKDESRASFTGVPRERNPYFSVKFVRYLLKCVLPFTPLLTHIMFALTNDDGAEDHQAAVENWNRHIKHDEQKQRKQKLGRYLQKSKEFLNGKIW